MILAALVIETVVQPMIVMEVETVIRHRAIVREEVIPIQMIVCQTSDRVWLSRSGISLNFINSKRIFIVNIRMSFHDR